VEAQLDDESSVLTLHRRALAGRPHGGFTWRESPRGTLVFERGELVCAVNVEAERFALPAGELVLASEPGIGSDLPRGTAAWLRGDTR